MSARLRQIAGQTVALVGAGGYETGTGRWVELGAAVRSAVSGTLLYLPDVELVAAAADRTASASASASVSASVEVTGESTLEAGRRLGPGTAVLIFASARNPGGGFLTGARAQEEDVARSSALHACLTSVPEFYAHHRADPDLRYSDRIIYSPAVPVFRDRTYGLLDEAYELAMLTAAAPNLGAIRRNQPEYVDSVPAILERRAERVLRVAAHHGHRTLVLGAWGCGVFENDPSVVAWAFARGLRQVPSFDRVVFAILDRRDTARDAFRAALLTPPITPPGR